LHVNPHDMPSHVATEFVGAVHATHEAPQFATELFATHVPPQLWKPVLHTQPHETPSHVGVAFAGAVHGIEHVVPQVIGLVFDAQVPPQR
jgi:hypothetical protein